MELITQQGEMFTTNYRSYPLVIMVLGGAAGRHRVLGEYVTGRSGLLGNQRRQI